MAKKVYVEPLTIKNKNMKSEKLYDCDRVAIRQASHYVNNSLEFRNFTAQEKEQIIDDIKNLMVSLCVVYENK